MRAMVRMATFDSILRVRVASGPTALSYGVASSRFCASTRSFHHLRPNSTMSSTPPVTLYTAGTPNGWKASIALEELGVPYKVHPISFKENEQKQEWFLKINPNGRIPAMTDEANDGFNVFESGAILLYLGENYDPQHKILPADPKLRSEAIQWVFWQVGGLGPMMGQANHFVRYAPEKIEYAINRYKDESLRLLQVIERQLKDGREYLVGPYSIADISCFGWVAGYGYPGLSLETVPFVEKWLHRMGERPAVRRGLDVPIKSTLIDDGFKIPESEAEKIAKEGQKWIFNKKEEESKAN